jgi:hypothetical protein
MVRLIDCVLMSPVVVAPEHPIFKATKLFNLGFTRFNVCWFILSLLCFPLSYFFYVFSDLFILVSMSKSVRPWQRTDNYAAHD